MYLHGSHITRIGRLKAMHPHDIFEFQPAWLGLQFAQSGHVNPAATRLVRAAWVDKSSRVPFLLQISTENFEKKTVIFFVWSASLHCCAFPSDGVHCHKLMFGRNTPRSIGWEFCNNIRSFRIEPPRLKQFYTKNIDIRETKKECQV